MWTKETAGAELTNRIERQRMYSFDKTMFDSEVRLIKTIPNQLQLITNCADDQNGVWFLLAHQQSEPELQTVSDLSALLAGAVVHHRRDVGERRQVSQL